MNGVADTAAPASKRSTSPRPPAVGEEVKQFHDTPQRFSELYYKNWKMESESKTSCDESTNYQVAGACAESATESSACMAASSTSSPPPPIKWAQSLQYLLEDIQGVELFQKFLRQEGHDMRCLDFWFACRGVKKNNLNNSEGLAKLIKVVFEKKVKRISAISDETKQEIKRKLASKTDVNDTIFDAAQREVESHMTNTTYQNFIQSDVYLQYLRGCQNEQSPEKEQVVPPEPLDFLPTVHEDSELHIASNKIPSAKPSVLPRSKISTVSKFKPEGPAGFLRSPYNYHTKYASFLPTSAQDSELQSMSSDTQTDDTMSVTDSNVDFPMCNRSKQKRSLKVSKHGIINNERPEKPGVPFIPRTMRLREVSAAMPKTQQEFVSQLVERLNKVIEDRRADEKMAEKLKSVEAGYLTGPSEENVQDILDQHISRVFDSGQDSPASGCLSPPVARPSGNVPDKSRMPLRFTGCCEPSDLPSGASHKHNQTSQFTVPNSIKIRRDHDTHPTDATFGYMSDNVPSNYRNQYSSGVGNTENYRRSKEHSKRYASKKFSPMTDSNSSFVDSGISITESIPSYSNSNRRTVSCNSCRSGNQDMGCPHCSGAPSQLAQDSAPGYSCMDTTASLLEARRKLEDPKMKMKYSSGSRNSYDASRTKLPKGYESYDDGLCHRKTNKKSYSISAIENATASTPCNDVTVIGYSYGRHSVPYLSKLRGKDITLRHFKSLLSKKGNFRYFFKTASNDFGTGVVFEEVTDDHKVLPMWEGKVFCVIESMEDNSVL